MELHHRRLPCRKSNPDGSFADRINDDGLYIPETWIAHDKLLSLVERHHHGAHPASYRIVKCVDGCILFKLKCD